MFGAPGNQRHDGGMARQDYWHDPSAPNPTSLVVAVSAVVLDETGSILMIERTDSGLWSIPGGAVEPGETLSAALAREVYEETGYHIAITHLVGIFADPAHLIRYDDGEVRQEFSICFVATPTGGQARTSDESSQVAWIDRQRLSDLNIHPSIRRRIQTALDDQAKPYFT